MKKTSLKVDEESFTQLLNLTRSDIDWVENELNKMTLYEKCAQMVMPWVLGEYMNEDSKEYKRIIKLVKDEKVGGLIFFKGNVLNEALIINKMQKLAKVPLLIASDFERGLAMRLTDGIEYPYNMALAASGNKSLAYRMGEDVAEECRAIGVTQNYAPVADINNHPDNPIINIRAYSDDKDVVSEFCTEFIKGASSKRILTTAKHFPGHGDTKIDSHKELPVINLSRKELLQNELIPFKESIKAGVHSIMIGHLAVPAIDPSGTPATLSKPIITGLLKKELGFKGLVVTDAMNMNGVTKYYSAADAAVKAVEAGIDILLMPPDEEIAINSLVSAVKTKLISRSRIDESVRKVLAAKAWLKINKKHELNINKITSVVGKKAHIKLAEEIAEKSITVVKNDTDILPVDPDKYKRISCISIIDGDNIIDDILFHKLADDIFYDISHIVLNDKSNQNDFDNAYRKAKESSLILLPLYVKTKAYRGTISMPHEKQSFINNIIKLKSPSILMSFGSPYLLSNFSETKTYLCAYGDTSSSQRAMIKALLGQINIEGKLPVTITSTKFKIDSKNSL